MLRFPHMSSIKGFALSELSIRCARECWQQSFPAHSVMLSHWYFHSVRGKKTNKWNVKCFSQMHCLSLMPCKELAYLCLSYDAAQVVEVVCSFLVALCFETNHVFISLVSIGKVESYPWENTNLELPVGCCFWVACTCTVQGSSALAVLPSFLRVPENLDMTWKSIKRSSIIPNKKDMLTTTTKLLHCSTTGERLVCLKLLLRKCGETMRPMGLFRWISVSPRTWFKVCWQQRKQEDSENARLRFLWVFLLLPPLPLLCSYKSRFSLLASFFQSVSKHGKAFFYKAFAK